MKIQILQSAVVCESNKDETVLFALARSGITISAPCGGRHICGKCKVTLIHGEIRGDTPDEAGHFLACQGIPVTDIEIALLTDETILGNEVHEITAPDGPRKVPDRAGVALDIGTTTLSALLVDLDTGSSIETVSALNDQKVFGADVMSRINAAKNGKTGALFTLINQQTEKILRHFMESRGIHKIEKLIVSGNTTMLHLFANTDPSGMGEVPFTPVFLGEREFSGGDLSLSAEQVILLPSISAFVGGDIVAGLGAVDILTARDNSLLIDIGTNGEMALFHGGSLYCCSTAAGPAFEGAEISCGIGSVQGAINKVALLDGTVSFTTIGGTGPGAGGQKPLGICGCGLIDALAVMRTTGILDETGSLGDDYEEGFCICDGISIINRDVRQFQLAKSAILSGIKILCKNAGVDLKEIDTVFIAGGLGFFIDKQNAVITGLLPKEFLAKITVCGNLSLKGAAKCLTDPAFLKTCQHIIESSKTIELAADPAFMDEFAENMLFPDLF
ncbi:hypothetical protein FACS1894142_4400 [Spirochaetia bacterium]|nr:hypothetical protein FACS1894142_4400 [Spirochaetia bacterium]